MAFFLKGKRNQDKGFMIGLGLSFYIGAFIIIGCLEIVFARVNHLRSLLVGGVILIYMGALIICNGLYHTSLKSPGLLVILALFIIIGVSLVFVDISHVGTSKNVSLEKFSPGRIKSVLIFWWAANTFWTVWFLYAVMKNYKFPGRFL